MNIQRWTVTLVLVLFVSSSLRAQQPTGRAVMEAYKAQDMTEDSSVELTMTLINKRGSRREREVTLVTKTGADGLQKQLIRFLSPADVAGTGFLSIENAGRDDDTWLYLPALRKTRRIAGSDKRDSFIGTDFTYEDLESEKLDAYTYEVIGSETTGGTEAWIVEAVPTDPDKIEETVYSKRELWISKDHALILQAKLYDRSGVYIKRLQAGDVRQVPGTDRWRTYRLTMEDLREGSRTVLNITRFEIDQGISDDYFTERYLTRRP